MTSLAEILHNIADHTQTLWHLLEDPTVAPDVRQRLKQHMLLEEQENTNKLQTIQNAEPSLITQKLLDHSFLIQKMMQEEGISVELQRELLDHFMEEHQEWTTEYSALAPPSASSPSASSPSASSSGKSNASESTPGRSNPGNANNKWTVGPLWPQGG